MARVPKEKEVKATRLANTYGGWMYCEGCQKTIGYLCYVTYQQFDFIYECQCGNEGSVHISFETEYKGEESKHKLVPIKNRLTCPQDQSPLVSISDKKLKHYAYHAVCAQCHQVYKGEKEVS